MISLPALKPIKTHVQPPLAVDNVGGVDDVGGGGTAAVVPRESLPGDDVQPSSDVLVVRHSSNGVWGVFGGWG